MAVVLAILLAVILFTIPKYLELECKCKTGIKMIDVKISASYHHISEYRCYVQASKFRKSPSYSLGKPQTDFILLCSLGGVGPGRVKMSRHNKSPHSYANLFLIQEKYRIKS